MGVLFTPLAETDLEQIGDYIAQDNPARALTFMQEIPVRSGITSSFTNLMRPMC